MAMIQMHDSSWQLILGGNLLANFTSPNSKLKGTAYVGQEPGPLPSIPHSSLTSIIPSLCFTLSPTQSLPPWVLQGWTFSLLCQPHTFLSHLPYLSKNTPATSSTQTRWLCPRNFFSWCCKQPSGENEVREHLGELRLGRNQKASIPTSESQLLHPVTEL